MNSSNPYIYIVEGVRYSKEKIFSTLGLDEETFRFLIESSYLKQVSSEYSFRFVGTISVGAQIVCVLPKYYEKVELELRDLNADFALIVKVLKKAGATEASIPDYTNFSTNEDLNQSEIVIADKLLKDYLENGIFIKSENIVGLNFEGETDWGRTLELIDPVFSTSGPLYPDFYGFSDITAQYNIISDLHKWAIKTCLDKYGKLLDYSFSFDEDAIVDIRELGTLELLQGVLANELNNRFVDNDIILLKRLLSLIKHESCRFKGNFDIYGTGFFHVIWERVCGFFFTNRVEAFKKDFPSPVWHDLSGNSVAKETLIPDIVTFTQANTLFILDAKYYNVEFKDMPFNVSGNPSVGDVSKQFLYCKTFERLSYSKIVNCFIFPSLKSDIFSVIGYVTFALFSSLKIHIVFLSPQRAFEHYILNFETGEDLLILLAKKINQVDAL